jgi:hypothetical protein
MAMDTWHEWMDEYEKNPPPSPPQTPSLGELNDRLFIWLESRGYDVADPEMVAERKDVTDFRAHVLAQGDSETVAALDYWYLNQPEQWPIGLDVELTYGLIRVYCSPHPDLGL